MASGLDDGSTLADRVFALQQMADKTCLILQALYDEAKTKNAAGLALATAHLQDSLQVFAARCQDFIKDGGL